MWSAAKFSLSSALALESRHVLQKWEGWQVCRYFDILSLKVPITLAVDDKFCYFALDVLGVNKA